MGFCFYVLVHGWRIVGLWMCLTLRKPSWLRDKSEFGPGAGRGVIAWHPSNDQRASNSNGKLELGLFQVATTSLTPEELEVLAFPPLPRVSFHTTQTGSHIWLTDFPVSSPLAVCGAIPSPLSRDPHVRRTGTITKGATFVPQNR